MDAGPAGAAFSQLIQQLSAQHHREVAELRETIRDLRQIIERQVRVPAGSDPPRGDVGAPPKGSCEDLVGGRGTPAAEGAVKGLEVELFGRDGAGHGARCDEDPGAAELPTQAQDWGGSSELAQAKAAKRSRLQSSTFRSTPAMPQSRWIMLIDSVIGCIILANVVFIFLRLDFEGYEFAVERGFDTPGKWPALRGTFEVTQHVFCAIFLLELVVRLAFSRLAYFYSDRWEKFNTLDALLVLFNCIDLYVITPSSAEGSGSDLTMIRTLRLFRLFRGVRVVRTFDVFAELRILIGTVAASLYSLMWSMVLLFLTMLMTALFLTQLVKPFMEDPGISDETMAWMFQHYGTAGRSLWTAFEITFSGGWPRYARPLVEEAGVGFAWFFAAYIGAVVFAMTRIITALFLRDTLAVAANDAEMMIQQKTREKKAYAAKLRDLFLETDTSGDGKVSIDEFEALMNNPKAETYLATLELDAHEWKSLFSLLDNGDGEVTSDEFVQGAIRLKGTARSQDIVSIMHDFIQLNRKIDAMHSSIHELKEDQWRSGGGSANASL